MHQRIYEELTPSVRAFVDAAEQLGYRYVDDPNADLNNRMAARA